jgi:hypothetical protein
MIQITLALLGLILILFSLQDAFEVVLLSRPVERQVRLVNYFFRVTWALWSRLGRLFPSGIKREGFLGVYGPLSMVLLFICWAIAIIVGFGFLQWALQGTRVLPMRASLASWLYLSGDAFFTLGYENFPSRTDLSHILIIVEAGTGFGFIALMVSYLPVLHHDFSQRDKQIIQLDARAGTPPTVGVLLQRHAALGNLDTLNLWLHDWEIWASELIESHSSYPMLAFYRSQHQNQSWLASLALMLNCCSLVLSCSEDVPLLQAESTFASARRVLVEISRSLNVGPLRKTDLERASPAVLLRIEEMVVTAGWRWTCRAQAEDMIASLRASYEPMLDGLSSYLLLPLPGWIDNTQVLASDDGRKSVVSRLTRPFRLPEEPRTKRRGLVREIDRQPRKRSPAKM